MPPDPRISAQVNWTQYRPDRASGHYESFYQRANHPSRPWAFWIRYTLFSPRGHAEAAVGELWSVFFDGETGEHVVAKQTRPLRACLFDSAAFAIRVGDSTLGPGSLTGAAGPITWDLRYTSAEPPLYLLPGRLYRGGVPKAKSLVGAPLAEFTGTLRVGGRSIEIDRWLGSQNHNWGSRHTDRYAFGQVAGFDGAPGSFLEIATVQARLGPVTTPWLTPLVLRHRGVEHSLVGLRQARRARASYRYFRWDFESESDTVLISGHIAAPPDAFVALAYANPPGGVKHCLNTKIGSCELAIRHKSTGAREVLRAGHRALFEILTDDRDHGIPVRA
jgi:hypothetical protein